ncbi:MAG: ACP phosphodiesterase [Vicingaceae bacterium]
MNHLAHLYLSQTEVELLIGNFIADQVKGKAFHNFSEGIQKGIEMHRAIDTFTDEHRVVQKSKQRLYPTYHKYAAVIVDMYFDHFLAKAWSDYSPIKLETFASNVYRLLLARQHEMPERSQRILYYMSQGDWLSHYADKEGLRTALSGLDRRAKFPSRMANSVEDLYQHWEEFEGEFKQFFPELIAFAARWSRVED